MVDVLAMAWVYGSPDLSLMIRTGHGQILWCYIAKAKVTLVLQADVPFVLFLFNARLRLVQGFIIKIIRKSLIVVVITLFAQITGGTEVHLVSWDRTYRDC